MSYGQNDSTGVEAPSVSISGFMDVFYVYDFGRPNTALRQSFFYNHNRHNEFNLNLGYIKCNVIHSRYRASLGLQAGTYVNDNYTNEPGVLKNIQEANIGISLAKNNNLWLDVGIFPSHIGFESAVSIENWTLTRSVLAENSPYFLSGAKLTYQPSEHLTLVALVINGWQRIQRLQGNQLLSFGTQITYSPNNKFSFNWSTFIGTDDPDIQRRMRYFNNFYTQCNISKKIDFITGFDIGMQQKIRGSSAYNMWFSPVLILRYTMNENWKSALRVEYYQDKAGVIVYSGTPNGFNTSGVSWNVDYFPESHIAFRLEGRWLGSKDNIFVYQDKIKTNNFFISSSVALKFNY
jgi:hypothetical protein